MKVAGWAVYNCDTNTFYDTSLKNFSFCMQIGTNQGHKIRSFLKFYIMQTGSDFKASAAHLNPKFPWNAPPPSPLAMAREKRQSW